MFRQKKTAVILSLFLFLSDRGFKPWYHLCKLDSKAGFDPHTPPRPCPKGTTYNDTQG